MGFHEIDVLRYCDEVSGNPMVHMVTPEQILEVLGGLANLYLGQLICQGAKELRVATESAFASKYVSVTEVVQEIENCSGVKGSRRDAIFEAMQQALRAEFEEQEMSGIGNTLVLRPLGTFEVIDLDKSQYFLTYRDPAADDYPMFLLKERIRHAP